MIRVILSELLTTVSESDRTRGEKNREVESEMNLWKEEWMGYGKR